MITHNGITIELPLPNQDRIVDEGYLRMIVHGGNTDKEAGKLHGFIDGAEWIINLINNKK